MLGPLWAASTQGSWSEDFAGMRSTVSLGCAQGPSTAISVCQSRHTGALYSCAGVS